MREHLYQLLLRLMLALFRDEMRRDYRNGSTWRVHKSKIEDAK